MTVKEIYNETIIMLGQNGYGENLNNSDAFEKDFLCCLNKVILDLSDKPISVKSLRESIGMPINAKSALCNGTAMWLALLYGDATRHNFFVGVYNSMRTRYKSTFQAITDTMPQ